MSPTEHTILTTFLLSPAPLPTILPLQKFSALFPISTRANPQIQLLYRDLHHRRALAIDAVRKNIGREAKRGEVQRREVIRARRRDDREEYTGLDVTMEGMGPRIGNGQLDELGRGPADKAHGRAHTLLSILPELEAACGDLEDEIGELDQELERLMGEMQAIVGSLSDLRYGKFALQVGGGEVRDDVLEGLKGLRDR